MVNSRQKQDIAQIAGARRQKTLRSEEKTPEQRHQKKMTFSGGVSCAHRGQAVELLGELAAYCAQQLLQRGRQRRRQRRIGEAEA